jgi:hypothetical protein
LPENLIKTNPRPGCLGSQTLQTVGAPPGGAGPPGGGETDVPQLAAQETAGTLLVPFQEPRNPKLVLAPAPRLPL